MKNLLIVFVLFISYVLIQSPSWALSNDKAFTIYLIRHAEKQSNHPNKKDPPLTECGISRANQLSHFFEEVSLPIIYSTDYNRTQSTAAPIAQNKNVVVKHYSPTKLKTFSKQLLRLSSNTLVVGHSNTTNVLAGLLSNKSLEQIPENVYNRIYQVTVINGKSQLQIFQQPAVCQKAKSS
jgi:broad specificity phosphatase PhoE